MKDKCELIKKVNKLRTSGYIKESVVKILTGFFGIPTIISSEERDIRVVYDATKCGLNKAVWAPNFYLLTVDSALKLTECDSWFDDLDVGEMLFNYLLYQNMKSYPGVDVIDVATTQLGFKDGLNQMADVNVDIDTGSNIVGVVNAFSGIPVGYNNGLKSTMGVLMCVDICTRGYYWGEEV